MAALTDHDLALLRRAIALSRSTVEHGNHPFGALTAENTVVTEQDLVGHAETNLVRMATRIRPDLRAFSL